MCKKQSAETLTFLILQAGLFPAAPPLLILPPWLLQRLSPLRDVHPLVPPQVAQGATGVATLWAAVRLLAGVCAAMALQVDELRRGVRADWAAVWLVAVMRAHVALQVVGVTGGEVAQRARVKLGSQQGPGATRFTAPLSVCH